MIIIETGKVFAKVFKLSQRQNSMKCSRADSRIKMWRFADVAGIQLVPETSDNLHILIRLSARDHSTELFFFSSYSYSPIYQPVGLHTNPSNHPSILLLVGHSLFFVYLFLLLLFSFSFFWNEWKHLRFKLSEVLDINQLIKNTYRILFWNLEERHQCGDV
jgi:hypothetical protein